jgi:hypothetical protein
MPSIEWGHYLLDYLWDVGPTVDGAMGPARLTPPVLQSWEWETGIQLRPWQSKLLRRLSSEYAAESHMATKPDRPPPFAESSDAARLQQIELDRKLSTFLD